MELEICILSRTWKYRSYEGSMEVVVINPEMWILPKISVIKGS